MLLKKIVLKNYSKRCYTIKNLFKKNNVTNGPKISNTLDNEFSQHTQLWIIMIY